MITNIKLTGFKSFEDIDVALGPINVLIGANGSGKSNFIAFFDFLLAIWREGLRYEVAASGGVNQFLHFGRQRTKEIDWEVEIGGENSRYAATLTPTNGEALIFKQEVAMVRGAGRSLGAGHSETKLKTHTGENEKATRIIATIAQRVGRLATYHFHDTGSDSSFHQPSSTELRHARFRKHGENIAGFLYQLKQHSPKRYRLLRKTVTSVAPYFSDFEWETLGREKVSLVWRNRYGDEVLRFPDFSDGTQRFIALCCVFLQDDLPDTIVIDEPELGLHPTAIAKLVGLMRSAAGRGAQVIVATQSTALVDYFEPEEIVTVDQHLGATTLRRMERKGLDAWLDEYSLGDLWGQHIISAAQVELPND